MTGHERFRPMHNTPLRRAVPGDETETITVVTVDGTETDKIPVVETEPLLLPGRRLHTASDSRANTSVLSGDLDTPDPPEPQVIVKYKYAPFILVLLGAIGALAAFTLAIWVTAEGCNCPTQTTQAPPVPGP